MIVALLLATIYVGTIGDKLEYGTPKASDVIAAREGTLTVITGPIYDKSKPARTIGATGVRVPDAIFKAILDETPPRKMIAFIVDNADTKARPRQLVVTVDEVEHRTGFDLFSKLPEDEQSRLEARSDFGAW